MRTTIAPSPVAAFDSTECTRQLQQLRPQIGSYWWLWPILRLRSRQIKGFFPQRLFAKLKPMCRKPYFVGQMTEGTRFLGDLNDRYSASCGMDRTYEVWLVTLLKDLADKFPGSVLDVGSNQGAVGAALGRHIGPSRKLFAFEPTPETAARAAATLALNALPNAMLLPIAVGDSDEKITFHFREGQSDLASAARDLHEETGAYRKLSVEARRLDSLMESHFADRVGVIKIDVEGFEPQVVRGAQALIRRDRPAIMFEYVPEMAGPLGWTAEDVAQLITAAGGAYEFQTYHHAEGAIGFPPQRDTGVLNIVAIPHSP
jgi:FkbM family methyltransferase